jgi:hypothetical protein
MAKQRRTLGEVAFLASICPASQPNRAPLGRHARLGHTQSTLCNVQPVHQGDFRFLPHDPTRKIARIPRHRHRQLPHRIVQGIQDNLSPKLQVNSGWDVKIEISKKYLKVFLNKKFLNLLLWYFLKL